MGGSRAGRQIRAGRATRRSWCYGLLRREPVAATTSSITKAAATLTAVVVLVAGLAAAPSSAAAAVKKKVHYYGDSLLTEAHWELTSKYASKSGWALSQTWEPGIALCALVPLIQQDVANTNPYRIVIQTYGNVAASCTEDDMGQQLVVGSAGWLARYQQDYETILGVTDAAGTRVTLVESPAAEDHDLNAAEQSLNALMAQEAAAHQRVSLAVAPANAVEKNHAFSFSKACTAAEKVNPDSGCGTPKQGQILIRDPDGVHFCPVGHPDGGSQSDGCAVYSSGAVRFGDALVTAGTAPPKPINP
jgi:hypothetical protein